MRGSWSDWKSLINAAALPAPVGALVGICIIYFRYPRPLWLLIKIFLRERSYLSRNSPVYNSLVVYCWGSVFFRFSAFVQTIDEEMNSFESRNWLSPYSSNLCWCRMTLILFYLRGITLSLLKVDNRFNPFKLFAVVCWARSTLEFGCCAGYNRSRRISKMCFHAVVVLRDHWWLGILWKRRLPM